MEKSTGTLPRTGAQWGVWSALARLRKSKAIGPAVKLAFEMLWIGKLQGRAGYVNTSPGELAEQCGCDRRAGQKWLDALIDSGLIELADKREGTWRVYIPDPNDHPDVKRVVCDPQETLFEVESEVPAGLEQPATIAVRTVPAVGDDAGAADLCAHKGPPPKSPADLLVQKGPPAGIPKGPPPDDEMADLTRALAQRRVALNVRPPSEPQQVLGGPFSAERSAAPKLKLKASYEDLTKESLELKLAKTSAAAAIGSYHERRDALIERVCRRVPGLNRGVARAVADGVIGGLFEWSAVEDILDRCSSARVAWQYFVGAAKTLYRQVKAPWPNQSRRDRKEAT